MVYKHRITEPLAGLHDAARRDLLKTRLPTPIGPHFNPEIQSEIFAD